MLRCLYHLALTLVLLCAVSTASAQQPVPPGADSSARAQATAMLAGFMAGSYDSMTPMLDPMIVRSIGGISGMRRVLTGALDRGLRAQGKSLKGEPEVVEVSTDTVLSIVKTKKELQCTLPLHVIVAGGDPYYCGTSTIAGYSSDNGVTWRFVIESVATLESLRSMHSDFSTSLVVVPVEASVCDFAGKAEEKDE